MTKQKKSQLWTMLCAFACFMWGISGLFGKALFNLVSTATALWLSQVRMITAGLVLILIAVIRHQKPWRIWQDRGRTLRLIAYGLMGMLPVQFCYFMVIQLANASLATILQFIGPFFIMGYLAITKKQVIRRLDLLASVVAFLGVFLLATHGNVAHFSITPEVLFWGVLSAVGVMTNTLLPVKLLKTDSSATVSGWGLLVSGTALLLIHPAMPHVPNTVPVWVCLGGVIVLGTIIPFQLMTNSLRYIKPATASLLDAFEPLSATVGSVLVFGLTMTPLDVIGSLLVILAAMALNLSPKWRRKLISARLNRQ